VKDSLFWIGKWVHSISWRNVLDKRVIVKVKRQENNGDLPLPTYESDGSSGMDIRAAVSDPVELKPGEIKLIPTGLAVSVPKGYEMQIRPRSGLALKNGIGMVNSPGTIDSDYRGEIGIILINWGSKPFTIKRGDRIAQMILSKVYGAELTQVEELENTSRGRGGFGHTGVK
jgi:dUTP pyrophosphatase